MGQSLTRDRNAKGASSARRVLAVASMLLRPFGLRAITIINARFAFLAIPIGDLKLLHEIDLRAVLALAHVAA